MTDAVNHHPLTNPEDIERVKVHWDALTGERYERYVAHVVRRAFGLLEPPKPPRQYLMRQFMKSMGDVPK